LRGIMSSDIKYILAIDLGTSGPKVALVPVSDILKKYLDIYYKA